MPTELEEVSFSFPALDSISKWMLILCLSSQLVDFLHHGNTQIRQIGKTIQSSQLWNLTSWTCVDKAWPLSACENLVGFSTAQPSLFKRHQLLPVRDLKLLVRDYTVSYLESRGRKKKRLRTEFADCLLI